MNIKESLVKVVFKDDAGKEHVVQICDLIDSGTPIDEESGDDMEFIACHSLDLASIREQIQEDIMMLMDSGLDKERLEKFLCESVVNNFSKLKP